MSKSRKQILQELLDLENENVEGLEETPVLPSQEIETEIENPDSITRAKKTRTPKQLEAFEKAKAIRDANTLKRKEEAKLIAQQERKMIEEKLVKKAISIKKKQIKKQSIIDEMSDDDTPIEKIKELVAGKPTVAKPVPGGPCAPAPPSLSKELPADKPIMRYTFF